MPNGVIVTVGASGGDAGAGVGAGAGEGGDAAGEATVDGAGPVLEEHPAMATVTINASVYAARNRISPTETAVWRNRR